MPRKKIDAEMAAAKATGDPLKILVVALESVQFGLDGMMTVLQDHEARIALLEASSKR